MITWNENEVNKFRTLAVTKIEDVKVGETYYSNSFPGEFTVLELISTEEHYRRIGLEGEGSKLNAIWAVYENDDSMSAIPLTDFGVTAHPYNPWMMFKNEHIANAAKEMLIFGYEKDAFDDYDDYYGQECDWPD